MTFPVSEMLRICTHSLEAVAGEEAPQQARIIVSTVLGIEPAALAIHHWVQLTEEQIVQVGELMEERLTGKPLQYVLGEWSFMGLPFITDERALIPRQDTELLAETAIQYCRERGYKTCLDLCTGSGCVAISVAKATGVEMTASDVSEDALSLARENAVLNETQIQFLKSDLFGQIEGAFDLITCNPPYLTLEDMQKLQKEITFEPALALYGGGDGLDFYRKIAWEYKTHVNKGGALLLEIGSTQAQSTAALFDAKTSILNDLGGNPRVLVVEPQ